MNPSASTNLATGPAPSAFSVSQYCRLSDLPPGVRVACYSSPIILSGKARLVATAKPGEALAGTVAVRVLRLYGRRAQREERRSTAGRRLFLTYAGSGASFCRTKHVGLGSRIRQAAPCFVSLGSDSPNP
jgi:hypothetical protein